MPNLQEMLRELAAGRGTLLVALQEIQRRRGWISEEAIVAVAAAYSVSEAEVRGVIDFYSELRLTPPGRHRVCVCQGDSCAAVGARDVAQAVESHLNISPGRTTADGQFSYDTLFCLGNCALSPSATIDGQVCARLSPQEIVRRLKEVEGA